MDARIVHIKRRLSTLEEVDARNLRGPLKKWVERIIADDDTFLDQADDNADGQVDFEELVDALRDEADELIEAGPIVELISDAGLDAVAYIAVAIYKGTEKRLNLRLERLERVKDRLQQRFDQAA